MSLITTIGAVLSTSGSDGFDGVSSSSSPVKSSPLFCSSSSTESFSLLPVESSVPPITTFVVPLVFGLFSSSSPSSSKPSFVFSLSKSSSLVSLDLSVLLSFPFRLSSLGLANTKVPNPIKRKIITANMIPFLLSMKNLPSSNIIIPFFKSKSTILTIKYVFFVKF